MDVQTLGRKIASSGQGKPADKLTWATVVMVGFGLVGVWFLCEHRQYEVWPAAWTAAGVLALLIGTVTVPRLLKELVGGLTALNENVAAANALAARATGTDVSVGAEPTVDQAGRAQ